jgi:hypothetical protein
VIGTIKRGLMGIQLNYTDAAGNTLTNSYWRITYLYMSTPEHIARVVLYGYKDMASFKAGKAIIGQKEYSVSGAAFDSLMATHLAPGGPNVLKLLYDDLVKITKDIPDPDNPGQFLNFFQGGTDLIDPETGQ